MNKQLFIGILLFILLSTISLKEKFKIKQFELKEIYIENNIILDDKDLKRLLYPIYNKNLIFLSSIEVEKALLQNSFIESFNLKKKYPNKLLIKINEKKPIAVLLNKKKKFFLSDKFNLIEFQDFQIYQNLPYVFGDHEKFKIFYNNLKKTNFPYDKIKKFTLYESNRWDIETKNKVIIKLPADNYIESIENYLSISDDSEFENYKFFDYRIDNQLILK